MSRKTKAAPTEKRRSRVVPTICNVLGSLLLLAVIGLSVPLAVPRLMGYEIYDVVSGSMEPEIPMGSVIYVRTTDPAEVQEGDVVAYLSDDGSVVAHRVVTNRTSLGEFVTKGDANNTEDLAPVPYDALVGLVEKHVPGVGRFMALYASSVGKVYLLLTAACGVMLNILAERLREKSRAERLEDARAALATAAQGEGDEAPAANGAPAAQPRKRRHVLRKVLALLLACVFLGSGGVVAFVSYSRHQSDLLYEEAAQRFVTADEEAQKDAKKTLAPIKIDFDELRGVNEDVIGWLYCEDTPINYPVLRGETNDQYLRHDYTREYNINGSIFVDCDNAAGFADANTIIYGHHMNHGAMFATLDSWADQEYYEKHPVMWLLTPEQDYQVVLVSGHHTSAYSDMYEILHEHNADFDRFLAEAEEQSDFTPVDGATINRDRNYVMLTTCAYIFDNARYVIHGKLVPVDSAGGEAL